MTVTGLLPLSLSLFAAVYLLTSSNARQMERQRRREELARFNAGRELHTFFQEAKAKAKAAQEHQLQLQQDGADGGEGGAEALAWTLPPFPVGYSHVLPPSPPPPPGLEERGTEAEAGGGGDGPVPSFKAAGDAFLRPSGGAAQGAVGGEVRIPVYWYLMGVATCLLPGCIHTRYNDRCVCGHLPATQVDSRPRVPIQHHTGGGSGGGGGAARRVALAPPPGQRQQQQRRRWWRKRGRGRRVPAVADGAGGGRGQVAGHGGGGG